MECPHCEYKHGWDNKTYSVIDGDEGDFYKLPIKLERDRACWGKDEEYLYACPSCFKTFIDQP